MKRLINATMLGLIVGIVIAAYNGCNTPNAQVTVIKIPQHNAVPAVYAERHDYDC
jgi:hypothetical protein